MKEDKTKESIMETLEQILSRLQAQERAEQRKREDELMRIPRYYQSREYLAPLCTCDNCGQEKKLKPYKLNQGNALLCQSCFSLEQRFQTQDERGYTICDGSRDYHKRNFQSWHNTDWYGIEKPK